MRRGGIGLAALALGVLALMPGPVSADPLCTNNFATGGTVSLITEGSAQYCVHSFTTGGSFIAQVPLSVEYLVVGGGGGGGSSDLFNGVNYHSGGGGGAGGVRQGAGLAISVGTFGVVVGQGGTGGASGGTARGGNGGNSSFNGLTANGGGGGGGSTSQPVSVAPTPGGSGGGGGGRQSWDDQPATLGADGTTGQGNSGGNGRNGPNGGSQGGNAPEQTGGGGGGAGGAGGNGLTDLGGAGGVGITSAITGTSLSYAGGGGGGHRGTTGSGGSASHGGGTGGGGASAAIPGNGAANTGGGGGGAGRGQDQGGSGGAGIVIIRYLLPDPPQADAGPDQSVPGGLTVQLDGTASQPVGQITYQWTQTAGTPVTLANATTATPSFTAPSVSLSSETLTFALTVTSSGLSSTDSVTVTVTALQNPPPVGTGGTVVEFNDPDGAVTWRVHSFFGSGTLTLPVATQVEYLIVGGGGGGGGITNVNAGGAGGGGAGGLRQGMRAVAAGSFPITVGQGGTGASCGTSCAPGTNGGTSSFDGVIATGGGRGGYVGNNSGADGGSGGGGRLASSGAGGSGIAGQGNAGGSGVGAAETGTAGAAGGGGAGAAALSVTNDQGTAGGAGLESSITGIPTFYAGGGGGGGFSSGGGAGGAGGGGNAPATRGPGQPGGVNTGGGGGGSTGSESGAAFNGGNGGSGIVILRYVINTRPTANAGPDATVFAGQEVTLDGTGSSDPDDNITSYAWVQTGGPVVALTGANTAQPGFTADQPASGAETLTFELTVTDAFGLSHTDTVTITLQGVAVLAAEKTVFVFSENGSGCDDFSATAPEEPALPAAIPGACIEYVITITNSGPVVATNVGLVDELPETVTADATLLSGWTTPPTEDLSCSAGVCTLTITDGGIDANGGEAVIRIRARIN